jgi:hypothetical protein
MRKHSVLRPKGSHRRMKFVVIHFDDLLSRNDSNDYLLIHFIILVIYSMQSITYLDCYLMASQKSVGWNISEEIETIDLPRKYIEIGKIEISFIYINSFQLLFLFMSETDSDTSISQRSERKKIILLEVFICLVR